MRLLGSWGGLVTQRLPLLPTHLQQDAQVLRFHRLCLGHHTLHPQSFSSVKWGQVAEKKFGAQCVLQLWISEGFMIALPHYMYVTCQRTLGQYSINPLIFPQQMYK